MTFFVLFEGVYEFWISLCGMGKEIAELLFQRFLITFDSEDI
jgi:hypothetical protein